MTWAHRRSSRHARRSARWPVQQLPPGASEARPHPSLREPSAGERTRVGICRDEKFMSGSRDCRLFETRPADSGYVAALVAVIADDRAEQRSGIRRRQSFFGDALLVEPRAGRTRSGVRKSTTSMLTGQRFSFADERTSISARCEQNAKQIASPRNFATASDSRGW